MSEETLKKIKAAGYFVNVWSFGIDVFRKRLNLSNKLMFHGLEVEIIAWLKENDEWNV